MYVVLLSGGSGLRLWPLSNQLRSKQYIKLLSKEGTGEPCSMVQRVWAQLETAGLSENSLICASRGQVEIIRSQLGGVDIAVEPDRRDTFPAAALSCAYLVSKMGASFDDIVCFLPVDPYTDASYFESVKMLPRQLVSSGADIALLGAVPAYPSSKYGYIVPGHIEGGEANAESFKEKPTEQEAEALIRRGALWNCGVFCLRVGDVLRHLEKFKIPPQYDRVYREYDRLPKTSFDYQILERCENITVRVFGGYWKDLGTWNTLTEEMHSPVVGKALVDESCENTSVINELNIPLVAVGVSDLAVVASPDGILVCDKAKSASLKEKVGKLCAAPMYEERRWGTITVMDVAEQDGILQTTRKITLFENQNSSYHFHLARDEVWTVLEGEGELIMNGRQSVLKRGDVIKIPAGTKHAVRALQALKLIEIQFGKTIADADLNRITLNWDEIECKKPRAVLLKERRLS